MRNLLIFSFGTYKEYNCIYLVPTFSLVHFKAIFSKQYRKYTFPKIQVSWLIFYISISINIKP
jgi:hypothetical protein